MGTALKYLQEQDVSVRLVGDGRMAVTGNLTDDTRRYIRIHKAELLRELAAANDSIQRRTVLPFKLDASQGGNTGGVVISDNDLVTCAQALFERYGARLDLDDLLEGIRERFAIVAESAPDNVALQLALAEAETVILRAMQSTRHGHQGNKHE